MLKYCFTINMILASFLDPNSRGNSWGVTARQGVNKMPDYDITACPY